jgi:hypothetical protein
MKHLPVCLLLLLIASKGFAQVTIGGTTTNFDITGKAAVVTLKIPVKADPAVLPTVSFPHHHPAFVQIGANNDSKYTRAISFHYDSLAAILEVTVTADSLDLQGTYGVNLLYVLGKSKSPNYLPFNLVKPAAVLTSVNTVTITKTGGEIKYVPVVVYETGNRASLRDISFSSYLPEVNSEGLVRFAKPIPVVDAGHKQNISYTIDTPKLDVVPLGTHTGTLYLSSNSLAAPLNIPFVVTRKLWAGWIILTVLIGLAVSYVVKQVLAVQKDNEGLRLSAYRLIADLLDFAKTTHDQAYLDRVDTCIRALKAIISDSYQLTSQDLAQAQTAVQAQKIAFLQISTDFYNALNTAKQTFSALDNALYAKNLQPAILQVLEPAQALLPPVFAAIEAKDPAKATVGLLALNQEIEAAIARYKSYFTSLEKALTDKTSYPGNTLATYTAASAKIGTVAAAVTPLDPTTDHAGVIARLNTQQQLLEEIPGGLRDNLENDFATIGIQLDQQAALKVLTNAWLNSLTSALANTDRADDASHYKLGAAATKIDQAVAVIQAQPAADTAGEDESFGHQTDAVRKMNLIEDDSPADTALVRPPQPDFQFTTGSSKPGDIALMLSKTKERYWLYSLVQTGILALLISLGAYSSLQATFVGLPTDFIGIFLLAFSMDIVVANVAQFKAKVP